MFLYDFNALDQNSQAEYTWQHGEHIAITFGENRNCTLYRTPNFYVEFTIEANQITKIHAFKQGALLDKYLDQISVDTLLK